MSNSIKFSAEVWLHSHAETGDPCEYEVFNVSGDKIPTHLIEHMMGCNTEWEWLARAGVPVDRVARVQATAWFDDGDGGEGGYSPYWDLDCQGWMDITPAEEKWRTANGQTTIT